MAQTRHNRRSGNANPHANTAANAHANRNVNGNINGNANGNVVVIALQEVNHASAGDLRQQLSRLPPDLRQHLSLQKSVERLVAGNE